MTTPPSRKKLPVKDRKAAETVIADITIGTMVRRARRSADEIAEQADFFSFGTNDLTQLTFGFSRDDVEAG